VAAHGTPQQVALRCRIVLAAAEEQSDVAIAEQFSVNRKTVILWRRRFAEQRLDGLWEVAPGRGRKPTYDMDKIAAIVDATLQTKPEGMTALELPDDGQDSRRQQVHHQQHLASAQSEAASRRNLQTLAR
jgi:transposase